MEEKILLYDPNNIKIGETYVRRARQLVKQQRALWTDDSQKAIRFVAGAEYSETTGDEEVQDALSEEASGFRPVHDKRLMRLARRRVVLGIVFKSICATYLAVNAFLIAIWLFASGGGYFWPGWVMAGWGLGIVILGIIFKGVTSHDLGLNDKVIDEYRKLEK